MNSGNKPKIIIISGPTASGKSDLAIALARKVDGEVISADSRQVYRGMDIGTGKVTKAEQRLVRHWMLDIASPKRHYTVAHWKKAAQRAIRDIIRRGKVPVICGGTAFWIDALIYDLAIPEVKPDPRLRARLAKFTPAQLYERLQKLDPARAAAIDRHNPLRLIRALEIIMITGRPVPSKSNGSPYDLLYLAVSMSREKLARRIAARLDARLAHGMLAEVRRLHRNGVPYRRLESFGLEYRWLAQYLQKKISRNQMREGLLRDIIRYSKRQMTWLRGNDDVVWITGPAEAFRHARRFLNEKSPRT